MFNIRRTMVALLGVGICSAVACAHEPPGSNDDLGLSDDLRGLLQQEMREITAAGQALVVALASGDWKAIIGISEQINASYVMAKNLTDAQKHELEEKLPDRFRELDSDFHARAVKLGLAAAARDPEAVAFQYSRLLESCASCHAHYAQSRFPGFSPKSPEAGHHH